MESYTNKKSSFSNFTVGVQISENSVPKLIFLEPLKPKGVQVF